MKQLVATLFFVIIACNEPSQQITAGLIMPTKDFKTCCFLIPESGLEFYNQPNGTVVGKIELGKPDGNNEFYSAFSCKKGKEEGLDDTDFEMVKYDVMALKFTDFKSNFVKLKNGYWISVEELKAKGLKTISWMDYALEKETEWFAKGSGIYLREMPSTQSKTILKLKGELLGIQLSNEVEGKWCKVKVNQYIIKPSSGENKLVVKTYIGWIKLLSEDGTLNVWYYNKGC